MAPASTSASQTCGRVAGRDQQLDPVLARVAGPGDQRAGRPGHVQPRRAEAGGQLAVDQPRHQAARLRTLHGDHRVVVQAVVDGDVVAAGLAAHPRQVALVVGGVGDGQEPVAVAIGEEVVEHAAVLAAQHRVLRAVDGDLGDVVGEHALQERLGVRPRRLHLAHVRDVEDADPLAHRDVLLADARVLDRHLPAGERDEARASRHVAVVQRGALQRLGTGGHATPDPSSGLGDGGRAAAVVRGAPGLDHGGVELACRRARSSASACSGVRAAR